MHQNRPEEVCAHSSLCLHSQGTIGTQRPVPLSPLALQGGPRQGETTQPPCPHSASSGHTQLPQGLWPCQDVPLQ